MIRGRRNEKGVGGGLGGVGRADCSVGSRQWLFLLDFVEIPNEKFAEKTSPRRSLECRKKN